METLIFDKAHSRGHTNIGWLDSFHSFSFGEYHNPERMGFGALRVINDDTIKPKTGFGKHPHKNMEIITIMLEGKLLHEDDFNSKALLKKGDVQVISAGKGILHSATNPDETVNCELLQIWVMPNEQNVTPSYRSSSIDFKECQNKFQQIISPLKTGDGLWIHQNAWFSIVRLDINTTANYTINDNNNGVYIFIMQGSAMLNDTILRKRDAIGIKSLNEISITAKENGTDVLVVEIPF